MDHVIDRARRDWWVLLVLGITVLGTLMHHQGGGYRDPDVWAGVLAALAVVPLFWRECRPELTVVANAAVVVAYFVSSPGFPDGPIYLSIFFSTYALSARRPPKVWLPYVGGALVAIMVALLAREARVDSSSAFGMAARLIWLAMIDSASAALAVALRSRRETRAELVRRTATEEQLRMAQDLHDGVGHGLAVIAMQAGVALHVLDRDPAAARRSLEAIRDTSRESLDALRAELGRLAPPQGDPAPRAPRNGLADLEVLGARVRAGGVDVRLEMPDDVVAAELPAEVDAVGYAVVQEALTNVLRHAGAAVATVRVRRDAGVLDIRVTDDGHVVAQPGTGLGIPGMRSRVEAVGGTLTTGPLPDHGYEVRALLPIDVRQEETT